MFHAEIIQPNVVKRQQLIVVNNAGSITTMSSTERYAFAARMNQVADLLGIPPKGRNRQFLLGKEFKVSQESARKWLEGESFPATEKCIEIAKRANISYEWLMTGRGSMQKDGRVYAGTPEEQVLHAMQNMDSATKYRLIQITQTLAAPVPEAIPPKEELSKEKTPQDSGPAKKKGKQKPGDREEFEYHGATDYVFDPEEEITQKRKSKE